MGHRGHTRPLAAAVRPRDCTAQRNIPEQRQNSAQCPTDQAGGRSRASLTTVREVIDQIGPLPSDLVAQPAFAAEVAGALADLPGSVNPEALPEMALRLALYRLGQDCATVCDDRDA